MSARRLMAAFVPAALLLTACGGDDAASGNDKWYGNWNRTGTQSTTCGLLNNTNQLTGILVIGAGTMPGTLQITADGCMVLWDVADTRATLRPGQMCTVSVNGFNATVTGTQGTAMLAGTTITGTQAGSANNGCSFMQQMTLNRM